MVQSATHPTEWHIFQVLQHLGLTRAHVAARVASDWQGLATAYPQVLGSLILVCPRGMPQEALAPLSARLLVVSGTHGRPAEALAHLLPRLPGAERRLLPDYASPNPYADIAAERPQALATAMLDFLAQRDQQQALPAVALPQGSGEVGAITYQIRGEGAPLLLLPLSVAPSQWEPVIPQLAARYCTITLRGAALGMVASLEARGHTDGYLRVVGNLLDAARIQPGETILEVGCGTGVLDRWMVQRTAGANRVTGVDVNRFLLQEAAALARKEGLEPLIDFREGSAEALPFAEHTFDVALSSTVIQRANADRMLAEMVRVTKPGGRVAIVGHAHDMPQWVNIPLPAALKAKIEAPGWHDAGADAGGCDEASLYRRMHQAGLTQVKMFPQFAAFSEALRLRQAQTTILATLNPDETRAWHSARAQAEAEGTFFIATPFHCAVGTKPPAVA
ncbi:MAG: methyltransferase domain-containing protein [Candidatus Tectimicrobiota bacterium]